MTDQEQVILKAIGLVKHGDAALISDVIKAVGYPKAMTKKILISLLNKGVVSLHRHDYPSSLTPIDRKVMVRIGKDYFNAVSMRKRNPQSGKGKKALRRTGRALKSAARGVLASGSEILGAGAMALNPTIAKRERNAAKKKTVKRKRNAESVLTEYDKRQALQIWDHVVSREPYKFESQFRAALDRHMKAFGHGSGSVRQSDMISYARRVRGNQWRKTSNPHKKIKGKKNASRSLHPSRKKTGRAGASTTIGRKSKTVQSKKRATVRRKASQTARRRSRTQTRNPSAESIRKEFAGSVNGSRDLFFPRGTPQGLAKLGKLVSITTEQGTIKPVHGTAWLCADTKEKLHIGATSNAPLFNGPARSFGKVSKVEYESSKPHLGYRGPIIWFHHMGEETKVKPTLHADGKGGLVFRGGQYRLTKRGIEN